MKHFAAALLALFLFISTTSYSQGISLPNAKRLAAFVIASPDSTEIEGDATSYNLWFPDAGINVLVATIAKQPVTLEIYPNGGDMWCVNFSCSAGNIYDGLYAVKYDSVNVVKMISKFNAMIATLNKVNGSMLNIQRAEQKRLHGEITKWAGKARDYKTFSVIDDGSWDDLDVILDWQGDAVNGVDGLIVFIFLEEPSNATLRKIVAKIK